MKNKTRNIFISIVITVLVVGSAPLRTTSAGPSAYTVPDLSPAWTTGIISDNVGPSGIVVADLNQDANVDIVTCSTGSAYVLNYVNDGTYNTTWYSENIQCRSITSGDRDANGSSELYIASDDGQVYLIDAVAYYFIGTFTLPDGMVADGIAVGDVDDDGDPEIVLACTGATLVFDAFSYNLEWQADGLGGEEVAIGNLDGDPVLEIVINSSPAHILNSKQKIQEWAYSGGFGIAMDTGDLDNDGLDEIAFIDDWDNAYVLEGDSQTFKWQRHDLLDLEAIDVADVNKDGFGEVVIGDGQWGNVSGYRGMNGDLLWAIPNPEHGVFGIGVGDSNNDSVDEIIWGAGLTSSGKDALFVGSWVTQTVDWGSDDLDGPLYIAAADVDLDGQNEFMMASYSTTSGYEGGTLRVYDGATHQIEWSTVVNDSYFNIYQMAVGQLDTDPALEIIIGGDNWYDTRLQSYDGINRSVEWTSPALGDYGGPPRAMALLDLDNDSIDEIVIGLSGQNVQVYHGASNIVQWDSGALDGYIQDLAVGDIDGDGIQDIGVLTSQSVYLFEAGTWTTKLHRLVTGGELVTIAEADLVSQGSLVLITTDDGTHHTIQAWSGPEFSVRWQRSLGEVYLKDLSSADLDLDGIRELILMGSEGIYGSAESILWIGSYTYPPFWEYKNKGAWGSINSVALSDLDSDGQLEFLFGSDSLIQIDEISMSTVDIYLAILPIVRKACLPIFSDDFSNPNSGWPNQDLSNVLFEYNNGEYRILVRPAWYAAGARPGLQASDYILSTDVRNQTGATGSYGLVFGLAQDWSTFYSLEVYPEGYYGIYRNTPGSVTPLSEGYSPYINQGTSTNNIKVERNGASINAYANDNLLASVSDSTYMGMRYFGLAVFTYDQPNADIRFDNFLVRPLICGSINSSLSIADGWLQSPNYNEFSLDLLEKYTNLKP